MTVPSPLRVLFVNRMAALVRGGGETFDLEISRALERLGVEVHYLVGAPLFGRAALPLSHPRVHYVHSPYWPWFPWDKVKGGWRIRTWEFQLFEILAARWIKQHAHQFDVIQICELPYLVKRLKGKGQSIEGSRFKVEGEEGRETRGMRHETACNVQHSSGGLAALFCSSKIQNPKSKIVLRLTAPNAYDPWGGIQLADAVIASGTSIEKIRTSLRPDVVNVPNGVDLGRFGIGDAGCGMRDAAEGLRLKVKGGGEEEREPEIRDLKLETEENKNLQPSTFNLQPGKHGTFRDQHKIPSSAPVLLYVARFQRFKNHALLLDAFSRLIRDLPEARLVLAGSGPLMRESEDTCQKSTARSRVVFLGETPFDQLADVYAAADIKVISSDYESFCFTAIEAMAAGLPVVTTDCGWVPGLIGDTSGPVQYQWPDEREDPLRFAGLPEGEKIRVVPGGLVVMRGDVQSLANAMIAMIRDARMREICGKWNRAKAEREHGWESSARKLLEVYERLQDEG